MNELVNKQDVANVLDMVLLDNKGNMLTEALCIGIRAAVQHYVEQLAASARSEQ